MKLKSIAVLLTLTIATMPVSAQISNEQMMQLANYINSNVDPKVVKQVQQLSQCGTIAKFFDSNLSNSLLEESYKRLLSGSEIDKKIAENYIVAGSMFFTSMLIEKQYVHQSNPEGSQTINATKGLYNKMCAQQQEFMIPLKWGNALGSDELAGVMASGYSNWMVAPYVILMVAAENKTDKANPNPELHMFTFNIPTTLKVCQKSKDVSMGIEKVDANGVVLKAEVKCASGWLKYQINEEGTQGSATPLDTMLRTGKVRISFSDDGALTFPSKGYAAWVDNKLAQQYVKQAKEDKENLRLNKFYAMHKDKVNDAQENLAKIFWCQDMGYNMNRFKGLVGKMVDFSVNHSHPVAYHKNREKLDSQYSTWPQSIARDVCSTAGHTRYTY